MICSLILEAGHKIRFDTIINQNWEGFELIYITPLDSHESDDQESKAMHNLLQQRFCKTIWAKTDPDGSFTNELWKKILNEAQGKYITWVHHQEEWGAGYLDQLRSILSEGESESSTNATSVSTITCGYGFIQQPGHTDVTPKLEFVTTKYPALNKPNLLYRNLNKPKYYNPLIKYFFGVQIIKENNIPYDYSLKQWQLRYSEFCLHYILTLKQLSGGREPDVLYNTLLFSLPSKVLLDTASIEDYQSLVVAKRHAIATSVFERSYWVILLIILRTKLRIVFQPTQTQQHISES